MVVAVDDDDDDDVSASDCGCGCGCNSCSCSCSCFVIHNHRHICTAAGKGHIRALIRADAAARRTLGTWPAFARSGKDILAALRDAGSVGETAEAAGTSRLDVVAPAV